MLSSSLSSLLYLAKEPAVVAKIPDNPAVQTSTDSCDCMAARLLGLHSWQGYEYSQNCREDHQPSIFAVNPLNPELNPICYLLALLGAHHFLHVSRIRVKLLTFRLLMSYIYGAPILDVSRSHTTTQHSR